MLAWDGAEMAALLAGESTSGPVSSGLREADVVLAWTRSSPVVAALARRARRVLVHDPNPPPGSGHASAWLARPLAELGVPPVETVPELEFTAEEMRAAAPLLRALPPGFLAVHPGSGSPAKNWRADRFLALAGRLSAGRPWLLLAGPAEPDVGSRPPEGALVARDLPLRVLGAILSRAGLYVGNDAGVTHLAAAAGAKTLALFGPTDPAVWAPLGRAVRTLRGPRAALDGLPLERVLEEAEDLLARSTSADSS